MALGCFDALKQVELAAMVQRAGSHRTSRMDANNWLRQQQDSMHLQILEDKLVPGPMTTGGFSYE